MLKKQIILLLSMLIYLSSIAQDNWEWAKNNVVGYMDNCTVNCNCIVQDQAGNTYVITNFNNNFTIIGNETVTNNGQSDMLLVKYDTNDNLEKVVHWGGSQDDFLVNILVAMDGSIYVTGYFRSPVIQIGSSILSNTGGHNSLLVKLDSDLNVLWIHAQGNNNSFWSRTLAEDSEGNVYFGGHYDTPTFNYEGTVITNSNNDFSADVFVAKFTSAGIFQWIRTIGGSKFDRLYAMKTNVDGTLILTGDFDSPSISKNSTTLINQGSRDIFILRYDTDGNLLQMKSFGGNKEDFGRDVTVDNQGNIYLAGFYRSDLLPIGNTILNNEGDYDFILVKLDALLNPLWVKTGGNNYSITAQNISINEESHEIYIGGEFNAPTFEIDDFTLTNFNNDFTTDLWYARYSSTNGDLNFIKSYGGSSDEEMTDLSFQKNQGLSVAGYFNSPVLKLDSIELTAVGSKNLFYGRLNSLISSTNGKNETLKSALSLTAFPNPNNGQFSIKSSSNQIFNLKLTVISIDGKKVWRKKLRRLNQAESFEFNLSFLPNGHYYLLFQSANQAWNKPIIIQKDLRP